MLRNPMVTASLTGVARCRLRGKFLNAAAVLIQLGILKDIDVCHSGKCES